MISITTIIRSKAPPRCISQFTQSGVAGWAGGGGGGLGSGGLDGGDSVGGGDGSSAGGDSVVKAPTALQALCVSELIALTFQ